MSTGIIKPFFSTTVNRLKSANLCVLGVPWDASSSYRKGASRAPLEIRRATSGSLYNSFTERGVDLTAAWRIYDCGDVECAATTSEMRRNVRKAVGRVYSNGMRLLFLGGDHAITLFCLSAITELSKQNWGLVYLDSHPDLYDVYEGDKYSHACVVTRIVEETTVPPEAVVEVGIRASTQQQLDYADKKEIRTITTSELQSEGASSAGDTVRKLLGGTEKIYLSIDFDVLDPAYAPGLGNPEPGGLSTRDVVDFIHSLEGLRIAAFDIVEICPRFDPSGITAFAAAKIIKETLGIMAKTSA